MSTVVEVKRLGAQGDGVADTPRGQVFIPFALPGETVNVALGKGRADLIAVLQPSTDRVAPACRHFGECGGCAVQHMTPSVYQDWKRDTVVQALESRALDVPVDELVTCAPHTRRRAVFTVRKTASGTLLGFNAALSHTIVAIEECPILLPHIEQRFDTLRELGGLLASGATPFKMTVTDSASGLDIAAEGCGTLAPAQRQRAVEFVLANALARLSVDGEIVVEPRKPVISIGGVDVHPPSGGFLQAVESAEAAMADLVCRHLSRGKALLDLFAGSGTFALRLAQRAAVHAVESDAAALAALDRGFRFASGLRRVTTERRDLYQRPMTWKDLGAFDGLVFDPPRAGAEEQARQIARSSVPKVAAVSCNPGTLARDLRILVDGGYSVVRVVPIDQFLWSAHVEAVALLEKPVKRKR